MWNVSVYRFQGNHPIPLNDVTEFKYHPPWVCCLWANLAWFAPLHASVIQLEETQHTTGKQTSKPLKAHDKSMNLRKREFPFAPWFLPSIRKLKWIPPCLFKYFQQKALVLCRPISPIILSNPISLLFKMKSLCQFNLGFPTRFILFFFIHLSFCWVTHPKQSRGNSETFPNFAAFEIQEHSAAIK